MTPTSKLNNQYVHLPLKVETVTVIGNEYLYLVSIDLETNISIWYPLTAVRIKIIKGSTRC